MDNNGGQNAGAQNTGYAGSAYVKAPAKTKKISGLAVVLMFVFLVVGFGGGAVVGGLMAGGTGTADEEEKNEPEITPVATVTSVDTAMQDELDKKIDAYEATKPGGMAIRPFHESYLSAEDKLYAVFNYMKDDQLKGLADATKNGIRPFETTIPIDTVKETYEAFFGEVLEESDMVNFMKCGLSPSSLTGVFEYDSANSQYKAVLPEEGGCGGYMIEFRFSYKDSYSVEGDKAYATVELGRSDSGQYTSGVTSGVYSDFVGGTKVSDLNADSALDAGYITEANKDSFTKYQYVFEKQDSGAWALKGLYPTEK